MGLRIWTLLLHWAIYFYPSIAKNPVEVVGERRVAVDLSSVAA